jgi:hypothetical protein
MSATQPATKKATTPIVDPAPPKSGPGIRLLDKAEVLAITGVTFPLCGPGCGLEHSRVHAWPAGSQCGARTRSTRGWPRFPFASSRATRRMRWITKTPRA